MKKLNALLILITLIFTGCADNSIEEFHAVKSAFPNSEISSIEIHDSPIFYSSAWFVVDSGGELWVVWTYGDKVTEVQNMRDSKIN